MTDPCGFSALLAILIAHGHPNQTLSLGHRVFVTSDRQKFSFERQEIHVALDKAKQSGDLNCCNPKRECILIAQILCSPSGEFSIVRVRIEENKQFTAWNH